MNRNYQAGRRAEWKARELLKEWGYHTVIRAAGSKGPVDLIGLNKGQIALVQVKRGGALPQAERRQLVALKRRLPWLCSVEVWRFIPGKRTPDVEVL